MNKENIYFAPHDDYGTNRFVGSRALLPEVERPSELTPEARAYAATPEGRSLVAEIKALRDPRAEAFGQLETALSRLQDRPL